MTGSLPTIRHIVSSSQSPLVAIYNSMVKTDTERALQKSLDEEPGDQTARMALADYLMEIDDGRGIGYRELARRGFWPYYAPNYTSTIVGNTSHHLIYSINSLFYPHCMGYASNYRRCSVPHGWLISTLGVNWRGDGSPESYSNWAYFLDREQAEDVLTLAFWLATPRQRAIWHNDRKGKRVEAQVQARRESRNG